MIIFLIATSILTGLSAKEHISNFKYHLSDEFFDYINGAQDSWTAGRNFPVNTPLEYLRKLPGVIKVNGTKPAIHWHIIEDSENLPETFDAREYWPNCESLKEIRDEGDCPSDWAFALVETMTDRVCIHSGGKENFHFSAYDLLKCCHMRCSGLDIRFCMGGDPYSAWSYYKQYGIVSGGNYNSSLGCKPYPYRKCNHVITDSGFNVENNTEDIINCSDVIQPHDQLCQQRCDSSSGLIYEEDKRAAKTTYIISADEKQIRQEIYKNGPVQGVLEVYSDFMSYKKGVYKHTAGEKLGIHAVKIIGWGVENNNKYWLVANSWNEYWGDQGFFKIVRGENHCGIEGDIITGIP